MATAIGDAYYMGPASQIGGTATGITPGVPSPTPNILTPGGGTQTPPWIPTGGPPLSGVLGTGGGVGGGYGGGGGAGGSSGASTGSQAVVISIGQGQESSQAIVGADTLPLLLGGGLALVLLVVMMRGRR